MIYKGRRVYIEYWMLCVNFYEILEIGILYKVYILIYIFRYKEKDIIISL